MLVLSRSKEQTIVITTQSGERIELTVLSNDRAKIGIVAPLSVKVLRGELEKKAA